MNKLAWVGLGLVLAGCANAPVLAPGNVLASADVGIQRASDLVGVVCRNQNLLFAAAQTGLGLAKASAEAWADNSKAEGALIALCANLPINLASVLPTVLAVQTQLQTTAVTGK